MTTKVISIIIREKEELIFEHLRNIIYKCLKQTREVYYYRVLYKHITVIGVHYYYLLTSSIILSHHLFIQSFLMKGKMPVNKDRVQLT